MAKEAGPETRVAIVPDNVKLLIKKGAKVRVEAGAGELSGFSDALYKEAGAEIAAEGAVWKSEVVVKINAPSAEQVKSVENRSIIAQLNSRLNTDIKPQLVEQKARAPPTGRALCCDRSNTESFVPVAERAPGRGPP